MSRVSSALVVVLVLAACDSKRGDADGDTVTTTTARGALTGSTALAAALSGKINGPAGVAAGGVIAASTPGALDVGDGGTASYRVPIWVPEGVRGVQPSLAVVHNSGAGRGLLGRKWDITGLSSISLCPRNLARDGSKAPIVVTPTYDNFCLDGQKLLRVSGTNTSGISEFRTEMNPTQKIVSMGFDPASGVTGFKVFHANGLVYYYGRGPETRLAPKLGGPAPNQGSFINFTWYLDKVEDRYGNSMHIQYTSQFAYTPNGKSTVQKLVPDLIQWGATGDTIGQRSIQFTYDAPTNADPNLDPFLDVTHVNGFTFVDGQRVKALTIKGPDGLGARPVLKKYNFTYTTPTITGEKLLSTISECDANNVCKRPTTITWEPGSLLYTGPTDLGVTDAALATFSPTTVNSSTVSNVSLLNVYRRLIAVDLNNDGKDDVVYRAHVSSGTSPTGKRLGWMARLNTSTPTTASFGSAYALPGADLSDPSPTTYPTTYYPYSGEPVFADLDLDGYQDFLMPGGTNYRLDTPTASPTYSVVRNKGLTAPGSFQNPFQISGTWGAGLSVGDVTGDGFPELLYGSGTVLTWRSLYSSTCHPTTVDCSLTTTGNFNVSVGMTGFQFIDMDGDGTMEAVANGLQPASTNPSRVTSPTINGDFLIPAVNPGNPPTEQTFQLDLNGDGLTDYASIRTSDPFRIYTKLSTGYGFIDGSIPMTSNAWVGQSWMKGYESGVRITDFNMDGRDDLILVDKAGLDADTSTLRVMLSNGLGGFTFMTTAIPIGDYADGARTAKTPTNPIGSCFPVSLCTYHGYRTSTVADVNGDGLPDWLQLEGGRLVAYLRQGKAPDVVTKISEGTGRAMDIAYAPVSDSLVYIASPAGCTEPADPLHRLTCMKRGWLPKQTTETNYESAGATVAQTTTYRFTGGLTSRFGRGFLGFERREVAGLLGSTTIDYDPRATTTAVTGVPAAYFYPKAFKPILVTSTYNTAPESYAYHQLSTAYSYKIDQKAIFYGGPLGPIFSGVAFSVLPSGSVSKHLNCMTSTCNPLSPYRILSWTEEALHWDDNRNLLDRTTTYKGDGGVALRTDVEVNTYTPPDFVNWIVNFNDTHKVTSTSYTVSPNETVTRAVRHTMDTSVNSITGLPVGEITTTEIEPFAGDESTYRLFNFNRDSRGRVWRIEDSDIFGVIGVSAARETMFDFQDGIDGVYVEAVHDFYGHINRIWRHPGLGFIVETDDPNNLASTASYDTFGRVVSQTEENGALTTYTYSDASDPIAVGGVDMTVKPEGSSNRAIKVHLDSLGREVSRVVPVDVNQAVASWNVYDGIGLLSKKVIKTGTLTTQATVRNTYDMMYDNLSRLRSNCHLTTTSTSTNYCQSNSYDGLTTTSTDEQGRVTTRIADQMGRTSMERADLQSGTSNGTFFYGAFGLLRTEKTSDDTGQTDFAYDVLGRPTLVTRSFSSGGGPRGTTYNAWGEITGTYKRNADGSHTDDVTFGHDNLGRLTSITSTDISRTFRWDVLSSGATAPYGIGKLIDMNGDQVNVHFDYGSNGMLSKKTWSASVYQGLFTTLGSMQYAYDSQGRIETLTYPTVAGWTNPLVIKYTYGQINGFFKTATDMANPSTPVWTVSSRNERGQPLSEALKVSGGPTVTRATAYYAQTGQRNTASLTGSGGVTSQLAYTYQKNGVPATFGMGGTASSTWTATFDYDNMNRLTSWKPNLSAPTVTYTYDSDGNLNQRSWSGETVGYGNLSIFPFGNWRYANVVQNGVTIRGDNYYADDWGRTNNTPAVSLTYNAMDEVTAIVDKVTNKPTQMLRDARGTRVLTQYNNPFPFTGTNGKNALYELDRFQFKQASSTGPFEERCRVQAGDLVIGDWVRTSNTGTRTATFYLTDNVGSVVAEASSAGAVTARSQRDPFGNLVSNANTPYLPADPSGTNPDGSSRFGFGGHERDGGWGLVDMKARFYSPMMGRFISIDSVIPNLLDRASYNPFAYVKNNPTSINDPTGHCGPDNYSDCGKEEMEAAQAQAIAQAQAEAQAEAQAIAEFEAGRPADYVIYGSVEQEWVNTQMEADGAMRANGYGAPSAAGDTLAISTSILANVAKNTPVPVWAPPSWGLPATGIRFETSLAEIEKNPFVKNLVEGEGVKSPGLKGMAALEELNKANENAALGVVGKESYDKYAAGDRRGGAVSALEFAVLLSASGLAALGAAGVGAAGVGAYALMKVLGYESMQGADYATRTGFPNNPSLDGM
jgi:RHS repeat-associated protein